MDIDKDNIVESYREHRGYWLGKSRVSERYLEIIDGIMEPDDWILDLGCGGGRMIFLLAGKFDTGVGVDISFDLILGASEKAVEMDLFNVSFIQGDLEEESTWDQCIDYIEGDNFDLIISNLMIRRDCCSADVIMGHILRSLREGGRIALRIQDEKDLSELGYPSPCYGRNEIMISLRKAGFKDVIVEKEVYHQNFSSAEFLMTFLERTGLKKYYENRGQIDQIDRKLKQISGKRGIRLQRHYLIVTGVK